MRKKIGEILVSNGAVSLADVDSALADQSAGEPSRLGDLLVATGKITSGQLARGLAEQYQLPYVELPPLPQAVLDLVPLEMQRQYRLVPLRSEGTELHVAMADLTNIEVIALLEQQWTKVHVNVAGGEEIDALHNTLSGIFHMPPETAPSVDVPPASEDLFGTLDLGEAPPIESSQSPVPVIAPVASPPLSALGYQPRPSQISASPKAEDLFGDLNLDSARTGIPTQSPEATALEKSASRVPPLEMPEPPLIKAEPTEAPIESPTIEGTPEAVVDARDEVRAPEPAEIAAADEASGPIIGLKEGTGPVLDLVVEAGTGPVVDTPFFRDAVLPPPAQVPSAASIIGQIAIPPPVPTAPNPPFVIPPKSTQPSMPAPGAELPDWLKTDPGSPVPAPAAPTAPGAWTGALDHLAPSKLVLGLTRALLARGLVTEDEILAALGEKKK